MGMPEPALLEVLLTQVLLLFAAALFCSWVAGRLKLAQPRLVGGLLVGVLLGPTVFGRVAPEYYEHIFLGTADQRQALEAYVHERQQTRKSLADTGVTSAAVEEFDRRTAAERSKLERALVDAERQHTANLRRLVMWLALPLFLLGAAAEVRDRRVVQFWRDAVPVGVSVVVIAGALAAGAAWLMLGQGWIDTPPASPIAWSTGLVLGCCIAALPLSRRLLSRLRRKAESPEADETPEIVRGAAAVNVMLVWLAILIIVPALVADGDSQVVSIPLRSVIVNLATIVILAAIAFAAVRGLIDPMVGYLQRRAQLDRAWSGSVMLLLAIALTAAMGWALSWQTAACGGALLAGFLVAASPHLRGVAGGLEPLTRGVAAPIIVAFAALQVDLVSHFDWVLVLLVLILCGDGKALGAMVGLGVVAGRSGVASLRTGAALSAGGVMPVAVALLLHQAGLIDAPVLAALLIAAFATAQVVVPALTVINNIWPSGESLDNPTDV